MIDTFSKRYLSSFLQQNRVSLTPVLPVFTAKDGEIGHLVAWKCRIQGGIMRVRWLDYPFRGLLFLEHTAVGCAARRRGMRSLRVRAVQPTAVCPRFPADLIGL